MARPKPLSWNDIPTHAKRKLLALLDQEDKAHPQGHYGNAVREAKKRLPLTPPSRIPARSSPKGNRISAMIKLDRTRNEAFRMVIQALKREGSISGAAGELGVHRRTIHMWMRRYPVLDAKVHQTLRKVHGKKAKPPSTKFEVD